MTDNPTDNLFRSVPETLPQELFETLAQGRNVRIERIVSQGHSSPPGFWYEQSEAEWVVVLQGAARLRLERESSDRSLLPGDYLLLESGCRHRVEWTSLDPPTIWLAVFFSMHDEAAST